MRLYGGRILKSKEQQSKSEKREMRDAVVMGLFPADNYCIVKIQGSDQEIKAYYNENWESSPKFLKVGSTVRVSSPGGNKGRIEVTGFGFISPTAIAGGSVTPVQPTPDDAILTGCELSADGTGMFAAVSVGTYRINGLVYTLGAMTMDIATTIMNRRDIIIGGSSGSVTFATAHPTLYRIDIVVVGIDGVLDVVQGVNAATDPQKKDVPTGHVLIGWALIIPGATIITNLVINANWTVSTPTTLILTDTTAPPLTTAFTLPWATETMDMNLKVVDQYGILLAGGYHVDVAFEASSGYGNGTLTTGTQSITTGTMNVSFSGDVDFTYTRITTPSVPSANASSPLFTFTESSFVLYTLQLITLEDVSGDIMF